MTQLPSLPEDVRAKVRAALDALGHPPSVREAQEIAKAAGCSASSVRRIAAKRDPAPTPAPAPKGNGTPREAVSPAIGKQTEQPRTYVSEECCGATWRLDAGEDMPNTCPGCGTVFA